MHLHLQVFCLACLLGRLLARLLACFLPSLLFSFMYVLCMYDVSIYPQRQLSLVEEKEVGVYQINNSSLAKQ